MKLTATSYISEACQRSTSPCLCCLQQSTAPFLQLSDHVATSIPSLQHHSVVFSNNCSSVIPWPQQLRLYNRISTVFSNIISIVLSNNSSCWSTLDLLGHPATPSNHVDHCSVSCDQCLHDKLLNLHLFRVISVFPASFKISISIIWISSVALTRTHLGWQKLLWKVSTTKLSLLLSLLRVLKKCLSICLEGYH